MLRYNTQLKTLALPEYGRNIQNMVEHCLTIEDRAERTRCAYSIVAAMANLFPELKSGGEYNHKLWDHLAIMSDFKLDIDYPCEVIRPDSLHTRPEKVKYSGRNNRFRQYGQVIQEIVEKAAGMQPGEERDTLVMMIANQMKKILISVNNEGAEDMRIFKDLAEMSHGEIRLDPEHTKLREYIPVVQPNGKKKKKK